jgi:hypothetical protein
VSADPLFRPEAVEHVRRAAGGGDIVRVAPRWTAIAVWTLAALFGGALLASVFIHVDRLRLVPAVAQAGSQQVQAVVPADAGSHLRVGAREDFAITETGERVAVRITRIGRPRDVGSGTRVIPVVARAEGATAGGAGVLELKVGERPLISELVPGSSGQQ